MDSFLNGLRKRVARLDSEERVPLFFRASNDEDKKELSSLLEQEPNCLVIDSIESQLRDFIKLENPQYSLTEAEYHQKIEAKLNGRPSEEYGVWVYYSWKNTLVHLLDEEEFIRVRTIRNAYKITFEEQAQLRTKKVGIIGLSVGQSVALAIAMERIAGEIRIADFDTLELSNLNRIRTGVQSIGIKKTTIVAREIAEIDPFISVICFDDGMTSGNASLFFEERGRLDLLVEECDSVDIKILSREEARKRQVPVLMETSDNFLIDIERFDYDSDRPLFHGLLVDLDIETPLRPEIRKEILMRVLDIQQISQRGMQSLQEIGISITTWPQLASDVFAGGALLSQFVRRILLGQKIPSGRIRFDILDYFKSKNQDKDLVNS